MEKWASFSYVRKSALHSTVLLLLRKQQVLKVSKFYPSKRKFLKILGNHITDSKALKPVYINKYTLKKVYLNEYLLNNVFPMISS
jgi:hypothetical protein